MSVPSCAANRSELISFLADSGSIFLRSSISRYLNNADHGALRRFYSVNHLHLHLLSLPLNKGKELKYRPSNPTPVAPPYSETGSYRRKEKVKGWSWFVEATQVIRILEGGKKVALRPVSVMVGQGERL